ncbi:PREDICTED: uncharacterized protein LOC109463677 [Branchiostoma belcheri]|uniref:Uncharacterized protein LOC109463677 n=1 Tax=Branchiostoma belcheri TaxID=7741 RepID=A0A6P4YBB7_BRABE|nr:PREDICTED: uncharacterized protein LOC109463677 [Branchiostoma belcheri]
MVVRRLQSYLEFFDPDHLKPEYGCDPLPNYATHLPSLEVHWNISRAYLNVDDNLPAEWFDWGSPSDARTLMIARVQHVYSATPTVAVNCFVKLESFMISGATLRVYYPGCPEGRYGGQCEHNCSCPDNATCHTLNGACKCPDGWTGQFCDKAALLTTHEVPMQSAATMEMTTTAKTPSPPPKPLSPPSSSSRLALKIALPIVLCLVVIVALVVTWWWTYWKKKAAHTKLVYESNPLYDEEGL